MLHSLLNTNQPYSQPSLSECPIISGPTSTTERYGPATMASSSICRVQDSSQAESQVEVVPQRFSTAQEGLSIQKMQSHKTEFLCPVGAVIERDRFGNEVELQCMKHIYQSPHAVAAVCCPHGVQLQLLSGAALSPSQIFISPSKAKFWVLNASF
jgi:hypothetical protein